jgi:hypothetical protein
MESKFIKDVTYEKKKEKKKKRKRNYKDVILVRYGFTGSI